MRSLDRLRGLRPEEIRVLVTGVLVLPLVEAGLRWAGFERMRRWMHRPDRPERQRERSKDHARAVTVARMVAVAGRHGFVRAACLPCSLLTWWMLRREGIGATLRIGVKPNGESLSAHAWVEHGGRPLGDDDRRDGSFAPFEGDLGSRPARRT